MVALCWAGDLPRQLLRIGVRLSLQLEAALNPIVKVNVVRRSTPSNSSCLMKQFIMFNETIHHF